ncbi:DUF885 domain-containing protein [Aliikangiella coralliicola]|uniref:DUF885 domain-containing protein n=1 Tax=Aliikangiella coralliicola TaxID=2592383 RepID=A0A545UDK0_9GAMM|nr:DUF885 domain-containing protein [Aliikangiella coralliicola]TQV87513.1 DUF885 domain-containing protein [Aliikangiella coralliicola]
MTKKNIALLFLLSMGFLSLASYAEAGANGKALHQLFAKDWQARLERNPMLATRMGVTNSAHLLFDASESAYQDWARKTQSFINELKKIEFQKLSKDDQINYQIFHQQLKRRLSEIQFKSYQIPFFSDSGFHTQMMRLNTEVPLKTAKDYENYIARLNGIPRYFKQNTDNMKNGLARGFSMPAVVMIGFSDVIKKAYSGGVAQSPLWQPFNKMPDSISAQDQKRLKLAGEKALQNAVLPAFQRLFRFFEETYIPKTKQSLGAYEFPDGKAYYAAQIAHYTTLDLSAEEIHNIGLKEVARIRAEMEEVIKETGFKGDFRAFLKHLRQSPEFYAKTPQDLIKEASYISKKMDGKLPSLFTRLPRQPYTVEPVPDAIAPKYTTGRYLSAPLDSERPGVYWVNTYALNKRPLYVLEALTLHEAVPGHHLQNALNQELENLPNFRRYSYISAFGEGWGLYSERLGLEVGFYQDPYSNFGRLTYEMWRAARLVIDTGIHSKGWTREQAIELLENNSALSTHNIRTEVDRYISWPGQALSYKLGEIKIRELRAKAEKALEGKFDIRLFHDEILKNGSIPLAVLESQIDDFISRQLKK